MMRMIGMAAMIGGGLLLAACNTVRGAGEDMQSAANCTENMMKQGQC